MIYRDYREVFNSNASLLFLSCNYYFVRVVPQKRYTLFVKVLRTDYDDADEYTDVTIDGVNIVKCEPRIYPVNNVVQDCTSTNGRSKHNSIS